MQTQSRNFISLSVFLLFIGLPGFMYAQKTPAQKLDMDLTLDFRKMQREAVNDNWDLFDSLMHAFKDRFKKDLATGTGLSCRFDSLSREMFIVQSSDKLLRIFSWDELSGGTWHDMASFAQFKTGTGAIGARQLDTDREAELDGYTDVIINKIYILTIKNKTHYLTIGYGTHGAGHHHQTAQIFSIEDKKLVRCKDCFESGEDLVVVSARSYDPGLIYDPASKKISYNEFAEDEGGFMIPTGKIITLRIQNNMFSK